MARYRSTPEERAARAEADNALVDAATRVLADPAALEHLVKQLLTIRSPRVLRFSLRNQALLMNQAHERGTTLTDLDTVYGWRDRGRAVRRGERGYRITVPKGTETADGNDETADAVTEPDRQGDGETGETTRSRFRMRPFFDIAQTDGIDDTLPGFQPSAVPDPAAELYEALADQLDRCGYAVVIDDVDAVEINDEANPPTVAVPEHDAVIGMARALGSLLSRPKDQRPRMRPPTRTPGSDAAWITDIPSGVRRVRLNMDPYGQAKVWVAPRLDTGTVVYKVNGPRVSGAFTVYSDDAAHHETVASARVRFGDWSTKDHHNPQAAPGLPMINNLEVHGGCRVARERIQDVDHRSVWVRRDIDGYNSREAPEKTAERAAAVVRAIVADWYTRDDLAELHQARARLEAPHYKAEAAREAARLDEQISRLTAERETAADRAARYAAITDDAEGDR